MDSNSIFYYIKQLETDLAAALQTIEAAAIAELQGQEPDQDYRDKVNRFIDLINKRYGFDNYTGDFFDGAPKNTQEIVRALWAIRPDMRDKEGVA